MTKWERATSHSTEHELSFLRDYAARKPEGFRLYATLILEGRRRWDQSVNVAEIEAECRELLTNLEGNMSATHRAPKGACDT